MLSGLVIYIMKKRYRIFSAAGCGVLLTLVALSGCKEEKGEAAPDLNFTTYFYDCLGEDLDADSLLPQGERHIRFIGQGVLPKDVGNSDIRHLRDSLLSLAGVEFVSDSDAQPVVESSIRLLDTPVDSLETCGESLRSLTVSLATPRVVVWQSYSYDYHCRAAHGLYSTTYVNFDIASSKILEMSDIFRPGYESELSDILDAKVREQGVGLLDESQKIGIPADFGITATGIRFVYSLYEIAPYAAGEVTVDLSSYEVDDLLTEQGRKLISPFVN